jgi:APA family basic amino acid/polyamine antiporter
LIFFSLLTFKVPMSVQTNKIGIATASTIVVANMIGTGVFTSVGFQLGTVQNTWTILILWIAGGLLALFGTFAYAELGTNFKESGGDYIYLSRIFHPLLGYLSAWAGLTVGFSAPIALAAMAFTKYLTPFGLANNVWLAIAVIMLIAVMHSFSIGHSSRFHNLTTAIKVAFLLVLIALGILLPAGNENALNFDNSWQSEILTPGFAVSMIYVSFAYTGWNAAAYVADEIHTPKRNLPRALVQSTVFVAIAYVLFQFVLLRHAAVSELQNKEEVTYISFSNLLGEGGGKWVSVFIAIQLVATISSYLWVGPRVTWAMATENKRWRFLAGKNRNGIPVAAIWAQVAMSIILTLTGSFEKVLLYSGFVLQLMATLTVAASLFIRRPAPGAFRSPWKPLLQITFLLFSAAVLVFTIASRPIETLFGIGLLLIGAILYYFDKPLVSISED